jgi:diguanylate cyclase (GGDEF)-like protein
MLAGGPRALRLLAQGRKSVWAALAAGLVLAGVLAAVLGARAVARSDSAKARLAFHLSSAEIASTLRLAIQHEEDLVVSASGFVTANQNASAAEFDKWAESVHAIQRYPELQDFGLVKLVATSHLATFKARLAANPVLPLGPQAAGPGQPLQVVPPGSRPYYCLAVAGLARSAATVLPPGLDYCALAPGLARARAAGLTTYAPVADGKTTMLGVETPVYRGGTVPSTVTARMREFVGWIGELLEPNVVLERAMESHPGIAAVFRYDSRESHIAFSGGRAPAGASSTGNDVQVGREAGLGNSHEGWTLQTFGAVAAAGVFDNGNSLALLIGGSLLGVTVGLLLLVLATGRTRALSLVSERTRELSEKNRELSHQALHDTLTGLPNRALVLDHARQMLARTARQPGMAASALFIDVDGFKHINDNLGHAAGDQVLRVVAKRLQSTVRKQDTVGRLGGDEFVALVESGADDATPDLLADRLTEVLREPVELQDGREIFSVSASIGVAVGQYASPDALLRDADLALYAAKSAGKDRHVLFEPSMNTSVADRSQLEADLSVALQDGQLFLLYQPILDLPSRVAVGVEALVRWRHPQRGVLPPAHFIALAEESGLIVPIGRWVLDEACRQAAAWAGEGLEIGVSVNVSAHQLGRSDFVEDVRRALQKSAIQASLLTLEITETTLVRNVSVACEQLEAIRALGVRVAMDDFGTGYASLAQLQRLPVDILKIDMCFVAALNKYGAWSRELTHASELLHAILGVGQALSLTVIAEGIEERSQMAALQAMGCEMGQGFLFSKPSAAEVIKRLLYPRAAQGSAGPPAV